MDDPLILLALAALGGLALLAILMLRQGATLHRVADNAHAAQGQSHALQSHVDNMARAQTEVMRAQAELTSRVQTVTEVIGRRQDELTRVLQERLDGMTQRLGTNLEAQTKSQTDNLAKLAERLAVIDRAQANITELSSQVVGLQDILANKQARGAFGQGRMEQIIADGLPKGVYTFQHTLSNGRRPDCAVRLPNQAGMMIIDAKFPLEAFNALRSAETPEALKAAQGRVKRDVTQHIADIAERYFIPGETQDTALLFVPSEALYAELHDHFDDIIQRAYQARVVIVSPTLLMLSIHVMQSTMRDVRMREQAHVIQSEVSKLLIDTSRLKDRVEKLSTHFDQSRRDIDNILISADKIEKRGARIVELETDDEDGLPPVVEPAFERPRLDA